MSFVSVAGVRAGYSQTLSVSRDLRAPGAWVKPWVDFLFPLVKLWVERRRASGSSVDADLMLLHFVHLMLWFKAQLESQTIRPHQDERQLKEIRNLTNKFGVKTTRD